MILKISEVRARLGASADRDTEILARVKGVEALFEREIDRSLYAVTDQVVVHTLDETQKRFRLKTYPITAFKMAAWPLGEDQPDFDDEDQELMTEDDDYSVNLEVGSVELIFLPMPIRRVVTKASGGLITTSGSPPVQVVPEDLREALTLQVLQQFALDRPDAVGLQQRRQGGKAGDLVTFDRTLGNRHSAFEAAIEMYRRR